MKNRDILIVLIVFIAIVIGSITFAMVSETKRNMLRILGDTKKLTEGFAYGDLLYINEVINELIPRADRLKESNSEKQFQEYAERLKKNTLNMQLYCKGNKIEELLEEYKSMLLNTCMECHKAYRKEE